MVDLISELDHQEKIVVWRRESLPLVLILLMIFVIHQFLPPNLPPIDLLRLADFLDY